MKLVLLIGPDHADRALPCFADYLLSRAVPHVVCSDPTQIGFGVTVESDGSARARLHLGRYGSVEGEDVGVLVRNTWALPLVKRTGRDDHFIAKEYHAALWSLCALLPRVINRPGRGAWSYDRESRHRLATWFLPEYWTTDPRTVLQQWHEAGSAEMHVEDLVSFHGRIFSDRDDWETWRVGGPRSGHLRALFAPSSRYIVHVCVAEKYFTVLNEPGHDVESPQHRSFIRGVTDTLASLGLRFFGISLVLDEEGQPHITRIVPDPPYSWYRRQAGAVHERLYSELQRYFPAEERVPG